MLFKLALRNTLRHKGRLILNALVVVIASFALVSSISTIVGTQNTLEGSVRNTLTGDIIIKPSKSPVDFFKFSSSRRLETMNGEQTKQIEKILSSHSEVAAVAPRIRLGSLVGNNKKSVPAMIMGVDPAREGLVATDTAEMVASLATSENAIISEYLLGRLRLEQGDEVVLFSETPDESFNAAKYDLAEVLNTPVLIDEYSKQSFYVNIETLQELLYLDQGASSEIVVRVNEGQHKNIPTIISKIQADISAQSLGDISVYSFNEVEKSIQGISAIAIGIGSINIGVIFLIMVVTIMIITGMTIHERRFEIGTLISLGMAPGSVTKLFMLEVFIKVSIGYLFGFVLAIMNLTRINESGGYQAKSLIDQYWYGGKVMFPVVDYNIVAWGFVIVLSVALLCTLGMSLKAGKKDVIQLLAYK